MLPLAVIAFCPAPDLSRKISRYSAITQYPRARENTSSSTNSAAFVQNSRSE